MAKDHTKADETPSWWWSQLEKAYGTFQRVEKKHYRRALRNILDLQVGPIVVGSEKTQPFDTGDEIQPYVEQIDILYLPRYMKWVRSQTFDDTPEIKYPRFSTPDTEYGDVVSEILTRVGDEADEWRSWGDCIEDAGTNGAFAVWYGVAVTDDVVSSELLYDSSKSPGELIDEGLQAGAGIARVGQDHATTMEVASQQALDPNVRLAAGGAETQSRLFDVAEAHAAALDQEEKRPKAYGFERNALWCLRRPVGEWTLWDPYCDDIRDARWVARKIVMDVDVARIHPAFRPSAARRLQSGNWRFTLKHEQTPIGGNPEDAEGLDACKVALWEIWDRKREERHYITQGMDEFLEKDASYPYRDERGDLLFGSFFPCVIHAPTYSNKMDPERPYGVPQMAPAWPLQRLAIKLLSHHLDAVKKMAVRQFVYDPNVKEDELSAMASGITGLGVKMPTGATDIKQVVWPLNYGSVPSEVFQQFVVCERKIAMVLAWPLSQMTGEPQADTATAEEISVMGGQSAMGEFVREMEIACAKGQEIKRALVRAFYTDDQIAELVGDEYLEGWKKWQASSLRGDKLMVEFTSRTRNENPIRRNQVFEAIQFLSSFKDPLTQIPKYEVEYLIDEWLRMLGLGKAVKHEPTQLELQMAMQMLMGGGPQGAPEEPKGNGKDARKPGERPPDRQQMSAAVGNVGPNPTRGRASAFQRQA